MLQHLLNQDSARIVIGHGVQKYFTRTNPEISKYIVSKGSVAVDGISLTLSEMDKESFSVALIPETLKRTTLGDARTGDSVNIETDIIVKTINKQLEKILPQQGRLSVEQLKELGF